MGPPERPPNDLQNQETTQRKERKRSRRRPRTRWCLLKGCASRYRPRQASQRYCSRRCREEARAWSRWKAQQRYRGTPAGQAKRRAQNRRYRERVRRRLAQVREGAEAAARVIPTDFFRSLLRPAGVLRGIRSQPEIAAPALLLEGMPAGCGARLGAGAALAAETRLASPFSRRAASGAVVRKNIIVVNLHEAVFMMQAAEHRPLHDAMTGGQFVSVAAVRNVGLGGLRKSRA